jgi:hypothetical protein
MPKKKSRRKKAPAEVVVARRSTRRIVTAVACLVALAGGVIGAFAHWRSSRLASPALRVAAMQQVEQWHDPYSPARPAKEYVYAGGRLVATEEPVTSKSYCYDEYGQPIRNCYHTLGGGGGGTDLSAADVEWTSLVNATASGSYLYKSANDWYWDAGALSTRGIASGDGYVEMTPDNTGTFRMFGLGTGNADPYYTNINFALYAGGDGTLHVYESGNYVGQIGTYAVGDKLRVAVENNVVKYYKNGAALYTSGVAPSYPLYVDASISTTYGNVTNTVIAAQHFKSPLPVENVTWANLVNATASGNNLYKSANDWYWDAGALSTRAIASGDGYVEMTPDNTGTFRMFGLGSGNADPNYTNINYALYAGGDGALHVYESGTYRGQVGTYAVGDKLRVAVESGVVKYYKNGALLYTSTVAPAYPLRLDTSISTTNGNVTNAVIAGTLMN